MQLGRAGDLVNVAPSPPLPESIKTKKKCSACGDEDDDEDHVVCCHSFLFFNETNVKDKLKENQLRHKGLPPTGTENVHFHEVLRDASQPR